MAASRKCDYKKTGGACSMSGAMYEVKLSGLLFLRAVNEGQDFCIASNMEAGGKFDDIVFSSGGNTTFVQLKHKTGKRQTVTERKLTEEVGDFSIPMYYKSYCELKNKWGQHPDLQHWGPFRDVRFVVYTNAAMTRTLGENVDDTALHDVLMTGGECIHFSGYDLLKDKPEANQFLHQFRYYTEQATEKKLDQFIKAELQTALGTDSHFEKFLSHVKNWWEGPGSFLTEDVEFWEQMVECSIADICKAKADQLSLLNVRFDERYLKSFRRQLPAEGGLLIVKNVNALTSLKVHQSVEKKIMIDANVLQDRMSEVLALWGRCPGWDILVVNGWGEEISELRKHLGSRKTLIEIHDGETTIQRNTLIDGEKLIETKTLSEIHDGEKMVERKIVTEIRDGEEMVGFKFRSYTDTFRFGQLDRETKRKVLECKLKFQGEFIKLKSLVDIRTFDEAVSAEIVIQVVSGNVEEIGKELTKQDEYYIPRIFLRREHVDRRIFFVENDCIVVSGVTQQYLQQLVPPGKSVERFNETKHNETSYCHHFVGSRMDFEMATKVYNCVHWLHKEESGFVWRQSKGGVTNILRHLIDETKSRSLRKAMQLSDKVKVLVAHPGMGKSTEIINLAQKFKRNDPACWVVTVVLNDHTDYLSGHQVSAIDLLIDAAKFDSAFQISLFEFELQNGGNIVILIDGFDEISPNYSDMVLNTLRQLTSYKFKQLWITSRSVMRKHLEREFSCLAFELQHLTKENQHNFLAKLWKCISDGPYDLKIFINKLLEVIGRSLNDKFTENPLQIFMFAKVFESNASHYCQTGNIEIPDKLDLFDLYCRILEIKWNIYMNEKGQGITTNIITQDVYQSQRKVFEENHMACALHSLLEHDDLEKLSCFHDIMRQVKDFQSRFYQGLDKIGIVVEIVNYRAVFIHRTLSEYFAAKWFAKNIKKEKKYLEKILFDQKFNVIRTFLHRILTQGLQLHMAVLNADTVSLLELLHSQRCDVNEKDKGGRTPLHLAVMNHTECHDEYGEYDGNYEAIRNTTTYKVVEILLDHGADCSIEDEVLCCQPLTLADRSGAWSVVEKLLERHAQSSDISFSLEHIKSKELLERNLKMVAEGGYINIAKFLFNSGVSVQHPIRVNAILESKAVTGTMLHVAAIAGKGEMVEFLLNAAKKELKVFNMWRYAVNMLFHRDENINIRDDMDNTALSYAARHGHVQIVTLLIDRRADCKSCNKDGDSPIFLAAEYGHVEVVRLLIERGIDVNACNQHGENLMFIATKHGLEELMKLVLERGINVHARNNDGDSLISIAVEYDRIDVVNLLIEEHGIDVNVCNKFGNSLTFIAAKCGYVDIVKLLIDKGADINARNNDGDSIALFAAENGLVEVVRLLIDNGANINKRNKHGQSPILIAALHNHQHIMWLLAENGADVNVCDKDGITPIMVAAKYCDVDTVRMLIEKNADVNARSKRGECAVLIATTVCREDVVRLLVEHRGTVDVCDAYGDTPLSNTFDWGPRSMENAIYELGTYYAPYDRYFFLSQ